MIEAHARASSTPIGRAGQGARGVPRQCALHGYYYPTKKKEEGEKKAQKGRFSSVVSIAYIITKHRSNPRRKNMILLCIQACSCIDAFFISFYILFLLFL